MEVPSRLTRSKGIPNVYRRCKWKDRGTNRTIPSTLIYMSRECKHPWSTNDILPHWPLQSWYHGGTQISNVSIDIILIRFNFTSMMENLTIIFLYRCWDGKNLDSPDHMGHMSYPESGSFETAGPCPASHPVRTSQLFYEVLFDTSKFNNKADWPADGSQPFVWSFGDGWVSFIKHCCLATEGRVLMSYL